MWRNLVVSMQGVGSMTARLGGQTLSPAPAGAAHLQRPFKGSRMQKFRPVQRLITTMSYPQAYPEPASAARSNRVYTNFAVRSLAALKHRDNCRDSAHAEFFWGCLEHDAKIPS